MAVASIMAQSWPWGIQVAVKKKRFWEPSFREVMQVWQLQEPFCNNYHTVWLDSEDLFCWFKRKKWTMAAVQAAENCGEWSLTWSHSTKFTSSSQSTKLIDIFPGPSLKWFMKIVSISMKILCNTMKWISQREFPSGGKAIVEQILASEDINKSSGAGLWESQSGIWLGKLTIWARLSSGGLSVSPV